MDSTGGFANVPPGMKPNETKGFSLGLSFRNNILVIESASIKVGDVIF